MVASLPCMSKQVAVATSMTEISIAVTSRLVRGNLLTGGSLHTTV